MTLLKKSLLLVLTVFCVQTIITVGLISVLVFSEKRAERLDYSRAAIYGSYRIVIALNEGLQLIGLVAVFGDENVKKKYESLTQEISTTLNRLRNDRYASAEDLKELEKLGDEAGFVLLQMRDFENNLFRCRSPESFIVEGSTFRSNILPYLTRVTTDAKIFSERHLAEQRELERRNSPVFLAGDLGFLFLVNIASTVIYVVGFNRSVVKRLAMITDNFARFAEKKSLSTMQTGQDEIALVDREFHSLTRALVNAAAKDNAVFQNMPVGLLTCDERGQILNENPCAHNLFGDLAAGVLLRDHVEEPQRLDDVLSEQSGGATRARVRTKDGTTVLAELSASRFEHDDMNYVIVAILDLSEREEVEKRRQEFINVLSHDIRTPISSVELLLDLIRNEQPLKEEKVYQRCALAKTHLRNVMKLTTNLLDIARIESGTIELNKQDYAIGALVEKSIEVVLEQAQQAGVRTVEEPTELFVECDSDRIQQVLVNLLSNALKYSPRGTCIMISAARIDNFARISVQDEGIGIPSSEIHSIFDRFKQARLADRKQGTGLGLAICKLLIESHGGKVGVNSVEGEGSEFWFTLPISIST